MAKQGERWSYWRKVVQEHAASGLTQAAFCATRGITRKSLQRWRGKLREELQLERVPAMVEVVVAERPAPRPTSPAVRDVELLIGGDCSLFFAPGTAPEYIADLLIALRERGAC